MNASTQTSSADNGTTYQYDTSYDHIPLRSLTDEQFLARYGTDRFTASILSSRMRYVVKHMSTGLMTTAFSIILRDWYDFAATISGPRELNYAMSTGSDSLSIFILAMPEAVRNLIEEFGYDNIRPGDVIIANDPYRAGLHVNDVAFILPLFVEGKIVSFVSLRAHQLDMGGTVAGGFSGSKTEICETGLVIPPTLLYREGKPVREAFNLIFENTRYGSLLLPDIKSVYQCLLLGERLLRESIERYGIDAYLGAIRYNCDVSADAMRDAIQSQIPDGVYEGSDALDADGIDDSREYRVNVRLTKYGENIELDFSGSSPQARTSINCGPIDVKAAVGVALKLLIEQKTPLSSGCYRNIDIVLPPGTFCSAIPPSGPIFMYWEPAIAILCALYKALEPALGENAIAGDYGSMMIHNGHGVLNDGTPWLTVALCGGEHGPWGATKAGDGDSYTVVPTGNNIDPATEAVESETPVIFLRKDYVIDSGGAGFNRGGAAVRKDTLWLTEGNHIPTPLHAKTPAGIGVNGGKSGTTQACWMFLPEAHSVSDKKELLPIDDSIFQKSSIAAGMLNATSKTLDPKGQYFYFAQQKSWHATPGTTMRFITGGGGGWGDPLARDPERVKQDVRDEYVSIEKAREDYGVVISGDPLRHPEKLTVDMEKTTVLREKLRAGLSS
ncbi:MAG: hydantoinase B/oxoprolinase family protein [Porticoccaceae bacterium]|nr:hydantoinase B/oxoprolinase family protein [Porticoccaceae bacterium]